MAYEQQIVTEPLTLQEALWIATDENIDAWCCGHMQLAEVVLFNPAIIEATENLVSTDAR